MGVEKPETGKSTKKTLRRGKEMRTNGNLAGGGVGGMKEQIQEMFYWHFYYKDKPSFLLVPGISGIPALWNAGSCSVRLTANELTTRSPAGCLIY